MSGNLARLFLVVLVVVGWACPRRQAGDTAPTMKSGEQVRAVFDHYSESIPMKCDDLFRAMTSKAHEARGDGAALITRMNDCLVSLRERRVPAVKRAIESRVEPRALNSAMLALMEDSSAFGAYAELFVRGQGMDSSHPSLLAEARRLRKELNDFFLQLGPFERTCPME